MVISSIIRSEPRQQKQDHDQKDHSQATAWMISPRSAMLAGLLRGSTQRQSGPGSERHGTPLFGIPEPDGLVHVKMAPEVSVATLLKLYRKSFIQIFGPE